MFQILILFTKILFNFVMIKTLISLSLDKDTKIDCSSHTQHYFTKEHEMRQVYYSTCTLDNMISALNIRFNQETIDIIKSVGMLLNLQISSDVINILTDTFDLDS